MPEPTFFEAARSQRGTRRYAPDPVPDDVLQRILEAATWAPSGSNRQPWHFIVIRDHEMKRKLGDLYRAGTAAAKGAEPGPPLLPPEDGGPPVFSDDLASVPVVIMVCLERWETRGRTSLRGANIFPAVQNLMLAAAALGLGTRLTTIWQHKDAEVTELLGIPEDMEAMALGYPGGDDHLGGSKRNPVSEVTHFDRW